MSGALQPVPSPGVAIFPDFIAKHPTSLLMKGEHSGQSFNITTMDGQPVFRIEAESMSLSNRKHVIDKKTGRRLCTIRKTTWTLGWKYYAETQENGPHLFDVEIHDSLTGAKSQMTFANAAEHGKLVQIDFKKGTFGMGGTAHISGVPVAVIEKKHFKMRHEYHLHIAAGLDMFLVVALITTMADKAKVEEDIVRHAS